MKYIALKIQRFLKSEDGPTTVEYSIMLALIVLVCMSAIQTVGQNAVGLYEDVAADMDNAMNGTVD